MKTPSERIASYKPRIERAKHWIEVYRGEGDIANRQHWLDVKADLEDRLRKAYAELKEKF